MTRLLVVDDDEDFAGAMRMMLQSRGYDVEMEHDTVNILQRLGQRLPDALILDAMFPRILSRALSWRVRFASASQVCR